MSERPIQILVEATPSVIRLSDAATLKRHTGFSPSSARRAAREEGFPIRVRGEGKGKREVVLMSEVLEWWRRNGRLGA